MSSPEMVAFLARQAAKKARAEEGIAKCQVLVDSATALVKQAKKLQHTLIGSPANALHDAKMAKASYSLAITHGLSNSQEFDKWMREGDLGYSKASTSVGDLERAVDQARQWASRKDSDMPSKLDAACAKMDELTPSGKKVIPSRPGRGGDVRGDSPSETEGWKIKVIGRERPFSCFYNGIFKEDFPTKAEAEKFIKEQKAKRSDAARNDAEGERLIKTVTGSAGTVKVYFNSEWEEFTARPNNGRGEKSWYHTDDKEDAISTAQVMSNDPRTFPSSKKADADARTWHVQIFKTPKSTSHVADIDVEASSKEEAAKKARQKYPSCTGIYVSENKADSKLDAACALVDSMCAKADAVPGYLVEWIESGKPKTRRFENHREAETLFNDLWDDKKVEEAWIVDGKGKTLDSFER